MRDNAKPKRVSPFVSVWELTRVRLLETIREPEAVFWVFVFPVLLALALGIAFRNRPPDLARVAVLAGAHGAESLAKALTAPDEIAVQVLDRTAASRSLHIGKVDLVVDVEQQDPPEASGPLNHVTYAYDPTRPEGRAARLLADRALQKSFGRADVITAEDHVITEPGDRYIDFLIPGLIGMNLMGSGMWGVGYAMVNARNRKLLKRFVATPMRRSHFLLSFILSRLVYLVPEVAVLIAFGWLAFGVGVQGSVTGLAVVAMTGAMTFAALGLLVGARTDSFEVASGWMNFVMLPMWLASGSFFSYERFPAITHPFIKALPLTAVNDALRAIMTDGRSVFSVWPQMAVMILWCVLPFVLALRVFKWR